MAVQNTNTNTPGEREQGFQEKPVKPVNAQNAILVSLEKNDVFYSRIAKRLLTGGQGREPFSEVIVTGLGVAIKVAIATAALLEKEEVAKMISINTSWLERGRTDSKTAKITIVLERNPSLPLAEDAAKVEA